MSLKDYEKSSKIAERVSKAIIADNVSHAYIIEGNSEQAEKFARDFLKAIKCRVAYGYGCDACLDCRKIDHDNDEDLLIIRAEAAPGVKNRSVKDANIEELRERLKNKPSGERNMVILADADTMTMKAQNELLKTLEEPASSSIILILCENINSLLQTIRSRCVKLTLSGDDVEISEEATTLSELVSDGENFTKLKTKALKDCQSKEEAFVLLDGLEMIYRNKLVNRELPIGEAKPAIEFIEEARRDLQIGVNFKTAIKNLLIKIGG